MFHLKVRRTDSSPQDEVSELEGRLTNPVANVPNKRIWA
jgi:hypothetical protein